MNGSMHVLTNESAWVARAVAEPAAFAALYDHYFPRVYNYVRYRVIDAPTADDLTAQIFERALADLASYRLERAPFGAWLFGIARHVIGDHFRAQHRHRWLPFEILRHHPSADPPPEQVAAINELHERLLNAVATLKDRDRDLIALKFGGDLTNREIARLTGLSESHVGVTLYRALRQLRVALDGDQDND